MVMSRRGYAAVTKSKEKLAAQAVIQKKKNDAELLRKKANKLKAVVKALYEDTLGANKSLASYSQSKTFTKFERDCTDPLIQIIPKGEVNKKMFHLISQHAAKHCNGMVAKEYVKYAFESCDYVFVSSSKLNWTRSGDVTKLCGYVFVKHEPNDIAYVDVVCSQNRQGLSLLDSVEDYCHKELKCRAIHLSALSHVICYYAQRGYRQTATENACEVIAPKLTGTRKGNPKTYKGNPIDGFKMAKCLAKGKEVSNPKALPAGCYNRK
jgi:hypothetical protein